ncbi:MULTISPECIES: hypothetical protein [unclassified Rhodococcus (in: high G+C Gram-positive bacteria)]|uniref:hypothetical protein n=1 Tax=unclassified Rhodococcus (in: high G+C Gram-positive bacteria) TaxID=192944 RepID=UPI002078AC1E|nr:MULTISPECIES: hypothetical protein [unclassified Rhodococcus (in: high G+C Gram-positive bacteria)]
MRPVTADAKMLLSVIERAPNLVAVSDYDSGRLLHLNPAGMHLVGLTDAAAVAARRAPEFFTDVGVVQAPEMESALLEQGQWEGRSEFRHFLHDPLTGLPNRALAHRQIDAALGHAGPSTPRRCC